MALAGVRRAATGYTAPMDKHLVSEATLYGWRRSVADRLAPRLPVSDETARALVGGAFFLASLLYVAKTARRALARAS